MPRATKRILRNELRSKLTVSIASGALPTAVPLTTATAAPDSFTSLRLRRCCVAGTKRAQHLMPPHRPTRAHGRLRCTSHSPTRPLHLVASERVPLHFWHTPQLTPGCVAHTTSPTAASTVPSEQGFLRQRFAHARTPAHCRASAVAVGQAARHNLMIGLCGALCATHTTPAPIVL